MKTQRILSLMTAIVAQLAFLSGAAQAATDTSNLMIYKFQQTKPETIDISRSYMKQLLPRENPDTLKESEQQLVTYVSDDDVNTTFEHDLVTGDISFQRYFGLYLGSFVPKLPSEDEALKYAVKFLETNDMMPANPKELTIAHIGGLRSNTIEKDGTPGEIVDKLRTITFSRELDGLPVIGAGSKLVVNIGDAGEVIGVVRRWRELDEPTRLDSSEIISEQEAKELAEKQIINEFGKDSSYEFEAIQIAYFDNNNAVIQPVFAMQTKIQLSDRNISPIDYICIIPAMIKPAEELNLLQTDDKALELIQGEESTIPDGSGKGAD